MTWWMYSVNSSRELYAWQNLKTMKSIVLQITSGRGPAECCWVVAKVLQQLLNEARSQGFEAEVLHREQGAENGTLFSATVKVEGKQLAAFVSSWEGTVQWIGQSQYRKYHKRKNWFIGVQRIELSGQSTLNDRDVRYDVFRAGGPGGQHVNKVSSAVRATHIPTGVAAKASDSRSQVQNRKSALERLKLALALHHKENLAGEARNNWQQHNELQRGNPVRVFTGTDFKRKAQKPSRKSERRNAKQQLKQRPLDEG